MEFIDFYPADLPETREEWDAYDAAYEEWSKLYPDKVPPPIEIDESDELFDAE